MITQGRKEAYPNIATFVIERLAGQGYCVTEAEGPKAKELEARALGLLDDLGQPNPNGPKVSHRLLGPLEGSNDIVATTITLKETGEAQYRQWWYCQPGSRVRRFSWLAYVACVFLGGVVGALLVKVNLDLRGPEKLSAQTTELPPSPPIAKEETQLREILEASKEVREKLATYLSLDGLAAPKAEVVPVKQAVMLNSIDPNVIPRDKQREDLDTQEVRLLLDLLAALKEWQQSPPTRGR